ncbi:hypothetical protein WA1_25230 [Scytonema hofmannii PCC 7110]|uniref:Uncharacterized protein n=1 Tax=Scytonema hofmannii PCC 7110 TaxID=128403 RepID=A0A139X8A7_9CYAN|nr:hypothetical protein [Scytonema hofmannii]KYC40920.1 hypothetical protein WA1_25230 [Scytonema hofmannii PCC 7110]
MSLLELEKDTELLKNQLIKNAREETKSQGNDLEEFIEKIEFSFHLQKYDFIYENLKKDFSLFSKFLKKIQEQDSSVENLDVKNQIKIRASQIDNFYKKLNNLINKYGDVLNNESLEKLKESKDFFGWRKETLKAAFLFQEIVELSQEKSQNSNVDLENAANKYYRGLLKLLDALEKYSRGAKYKEVMNIKEVAKTAVELLPSLNINGEKYNTIFKKIANIGKAILWEVDKYEKLRNNQRLIIGKMPFEKLLEESQKRIHLLDTLDPKTEEEMRDQVEALKILENRFKDR